MCFQNFMDFMHGGSKGQNWIKRTTELYRNVYYGYIFKLRDKFTHLSEIYVMDFIMDYAMRNQHMVRPKISKDHLKPRKLRSVEKEVERYCFCQVSKP